MAITYPYPTSYFADLLKTIDVVFSIKRFDQHSGSGDSRFWAAELADPLWSAEMSVAPSYHDEAKQLAALTNQLHGSLKSAMIYDPNSLYPQSDPGGLVINGSAVKVASISVDRMSISFKGLPADFVLTLADKGQMKFSSGPERNYFFEVSETTTASPLGVTPEFVVFPQVPIGVVVDDDVIMGKPACEMIIVPDGYTPPTRDIIISSGVSYKFIEKKTL